MANERGRFVWHELATSDTKAAQAFYKTVVGWDMEPMGNGGMDYTIAKAGETMAGGIMPIDDQMKAAGVSPRWIAYVEVPNIDETAAVAAKLGGTLAMGPHSVPGIGRFAAFVDPQGNQFAAITSEAQYPPESDPKRGEFSWHELVTADHVKAAAFYEQLFGWKKTDEFDMGAMGKYGMFGRDRFTYGGMMDRPDFIPHAYWLHYAMVDSADAAAERAKQAGGQVINGPMEVPGGDRVATIVDPQGAMFAVHSKKS